MNILGYNITTDLDRTAVRRPPSAVRLISTINPHSYCIAKRDPQFREALMGSDILLPDGSGIVLAAAILHRKKIKKIAGADLHLHILEQLNKENGRCFYLGASQKTLDLIRERLSREYPNVTAGFFSPPYKPGFTEEENKAMIEAVNEFATVASTGSATGMTTGSATGMTTSSATGMTTGSATDVTPSHRHAVTLFIGMTAPKQEKWAWKHKELLQVDTICSIGAVFDFYAGTVRRSSPIWIKLGLEWLPRLVREPRRLWKRMVLSAPEFMWDVVFRRQTADGGRQKVDGGRKTADGRGRTADGGQ